MEEETVQVQAEPQPRPQPIKKCPQNGDFLGTGRRKASVARVRVRPGSGTVTINKRQVEEYFPILTHRMDAMAPLKTTGAEGTVDVIIKVQGGGLTGQSGAVKLGIARALRNFNPELEPSLREAGLLTRDSRQVERKKYGKRGARRSFQFSKR
ncbi:MAG: 30S ribosomal protein S9 [Planctomycetales bacterium]